MVAAVMGVATIASSAIQAGAASDAAGKMGAAAGRASALLEPWVARGNQAGEMQGQLIGLNGYDAQDAAINRLKTGAEFVGLKKVGEEGILSNASATGGLRGGNVQGALSQYDQTLLSKVINDQYNRLGGLSAQGLGAVQGPNGQATQEINQGEAEAGGIMGVAKGLMGGINGLTNAAGVFMGGRPGTTATTPSGVPMVGSFGGGPQFA